MLWCARRISRLRMHCARRSAACEVRADASIRIGGLKASCEAKGLVADDTLDNRLQNQHGWFLEHAGLTLEQ